ncbi:hypothetical protein [Streptomyces sp. NBC_01373]|uniref:hypothetical protein n=1 Tax=Streptomyces sp. NBC_01373 TaxID=2903843 RepID=UPI002259EB3C|nr:hypothetical protein [Streptomyces sp. NBC_01373]MCX4698205.1 hypothetical protein [Streptomyces sp. NBC_01373]
MDSEPSNDPTRHHDPGRMLAQFADRILVVCPRCGGCALVVPRPGLPPPRYVTELMFQPRRLACGGCGAVSDWEPDVRGAGLVAATLGGTEEPFFGRPLWLQTRCVGHVLWAYNEEHVDELAAYVGASLRERGGTRPTRAMFARLPAWMKRSENRSGVLTGLETLRVLATRSAPADRADASHERGDRPRAYGALYFRGGPYEGRS